MDNILVVDDEQNIREVIESEIVGHGLKYVEASGGNEAFELFLKDDFDLVITDLQMENGSGDELIAKIRSQTHNFQVPAVVVSGFREQLEEKLLAFKDILFLDKPFQNDDIHQVLNLIFPETLPRKNNYDLLRQTHTILGHASEIIEKYYGPLKKDRKVYDSFVIPDKDLQYLPDKNFVASSHCLINDIKCQLIYIFDQKVTLEVLKSYGEITDKSDFFIFQTIKTFITKLHKETQEQARKTNINIDIKNINIIGTQSQNTSIFFETDTRFSSITTAVGESTISLIFLRL